MNEDIRKLIDTNVLVYAYDVSEKDKHNLAKKIVEEIWQKGGGVITLQNLSEFFVVVTKKVEYPLSINDARIIIKDIIKSTKWLVIDRDEETLIKSIELVESTGVHFWDALIATCMLENGIKVILTENEDDFKRVEGIQVVNPFSSQS
jgi:predicted nucleic acid-binding protein